MRIYSKKIIKILKKYYKNKKVYLFAITGDIDNLGVFVAKNGRVKAENLVDVYNHIIGDYIYKTYLKNNKNISLEYIPSGEEIYIIGISKYLNTINDLLENFSKNVNSRVIGNDYIYDDYVTISFGHHVFSRDEFLLKQIEDFIKKSSDKDTNNRYLNIQEYIREKLASKLDSEKFSTLPCPEKLGVGYRNIVFNEMLVYKKGTKELLKRIGKETKKDVSIEKDLESVSNKYGLSDETHKIIQEIIKKST